MSIDKKEKKRIDSVDSMIIKLLQKDGRLTNTEIAKQLDISEATVRVRLKKLIDEEIIQIVAVSNPYKLGFEITGDLHITIELNKIDLTITELKKLKELWFIVKTSGKASINAEFIVRSRDELNDLMYKKISSIDGILHVESTIILDYEKRKYDYGTS